MYSLGAKLFVVVCRSTSTVVTPTCISWSPTGSILNLSISANGNLLLYCISTSTWGNKRGELPLCINDMVDFVSDYTDEQSARAGELARRLQLVVEDNVRRFDLTP